MEKEMQTIKNDCVQQVAHTQTVVQTDIATTDRGGAQQLLSVNTEAVVNQVEAVAGEARVYGRVNYKILYMDRDGKINGLDYFGEFDIAVQEQAITTGDVSATADVLDAECSLAEDVIRLQTVCDVKLMQIVTHQAEAVAAVACEALCSDVTAVTLQPLGEMCFDVVDEQESKHGVDRVLLFDAKAVLSEVREGVDSTTVCGKLYADVLYLCQGEIASQPLCFDFAEELDVTGEADISLSLRSARLVVGGDDENATLRVEAVVCCKGYRVLSQSYRVVQDAYCQDADVTIAKDRFVCRRFAGMYHCAQPIGAQLDVQVPGVQHIEACCVSRVNVANVLPQDNSVTCEGVAVVGVLYRDVEGAIQAGQVEMPFSVNFAADGVNKDMLLTGTAIGVSPYAVNNGRVQMELWLAVKAYRPDVVCYATDITTTPCLRQDAVVSVYFADSRDSVWDIARAVHVAPSVLLQQNPNLTEAPIDGQRNKITVFRHRELQ